MRTLGAVPPEKRRRIARETLEIYAPIAHRLGPEQTRTASCRTCRFAHLYPLALRARWRRRVKAARGNRREVVGKILEAVEAHARRTPASRPTSYGREKTLFGIYKKMRDKHLSFAQVIDVYGFRVVVDTALDCYMALGALHALYKPVPGKFKDYIAIPQGQRLPVAAHHAGRPVRHAGRIPDPHRSKMHEIAEAGVAAHWLYKNGGAGPERRAAARAPVAASRCSTSRARAGDSAEFLEHVKIDLFPDAVYVFTPKSKIMRAAARRHARSTSPTAIHTDVGDQCVAVKINGELLPLRTELKSGDIVEIDHRAVFDAESRVARLRAHRQGALGDPPLPARPCGLNESVQLGERLVDQSLKGYGLALSEVTPEAWEKLAQWTGNKSRQEIFADIGLGRRVAAVMAKRIEVLMNGRDDDDSPRESFTTNTAPPVVITGTEGMSVQLSACCRPIPGDDIMGYIGIGLGMAIHTTECRVAQRIHKRDPGRWIDVAWAPQPGRLFDVAIKVLVKHIQGRVRPRGGRYHVRRCQHRPHRDGRGRDAGIHRAAFRDPGQRSRAPGERHAARAHESGRDAYRARAAERRAASSQYRRRHADRSRTRRLLIAWRSPLA